MRLKKILVVDDSQLLHRMYDLVLMRYRQEGCQVLHAYNGAEGLTLAQSHPDAELMLLDINMPELSGIDLLVRLRSIRWLAAGRVIMVSTEGREQDVSKALELGASGYVTKPFKPADLSAAIDALFPELQPAMGRRL